MAFKNLGNKRTGTSVKKSDLENTSGGSSKLSIYVDDSSFKDFYLNNVITPNPVADSLKESEYGNESEHVQPYINNFKTIDLFFSTSFPYTKMSWNPTWEGNWKTRSTVKVHDNVFLQLDDMSIETSIEETYENLWEKVMGNKIIGLVDKAASAARLASTAAGNSSATSGIGYPKYKNVMVMKEISTLGLPSSLTFKFNYGSAGLYSCEQEVVRPILALAKLYSPTIKNNFLYGNAPSNEWALSVIGKELINMIKNDKDVDTSSLEDTDEEGESSSLTEGIANKLTELQSKLYNKANEIAGKIVNGDYSEEGKFESKYKTLTLRIGRLSLPSMLPTTIKWKFDFNQVDEYGFPYKGEFTFDGLQTPMAADSNMILTPNV